jgi:hypothetical protein
VQEEAVNTIRTSVVRGAALSVAAFFALLSIGVWAQETPPANGPATEGSVRDLQEQVRQLRELVEAMRAENAQSRAEMQQLRHDLESTRAMLEPPAEPQPKGYGVQGNEAASVEHLPGTGEPAGQTAALEQRVQRLEESTSLMGAKIDEQYQTKVESASKYRARLHGIVLMNAFRNVGGANSLDFPDYAQPIDHGAPLATFGATLRQSELGLEIFGPNVFGARATANIQFDFAGGFPATGNGENFGIVRLQTGNLRLDWGHTSIIAGQDTLFISPLAPTSFASLATPAFAFAGNLWGWTPQLRIEQRFTVTDQQTISLQAGVLDNLDWEFPADPFYRYPQAGEKSGQPAYAVRTGWSRPVHEHPLSFGVAGYFGRQNWNWNRIVDAWGGMADWQIPLASRVSLSGEFYRGRGIGGLGAGVGRSIVYGGNPAYAFAPIRGVDSTGGWTQLKFQLTPKVELNGVIAQDNALTAKIRGFAFDRNNFVPILGRNRGALGNVVFRPRSDLVFSAELRRLETFPVYSSRTTTNQVSLAMGILF